MTTKDSICTKCSEPWHDNAHRCQDVLVREQAQEIARWREFHRAVRDDVLGEQPNWPDHGNAPLAIAATFVLFKNAAERNKAALDKAEAEIARLKAQRDEHIGHVTSLRNMQAGFITRAETAEAERDALRATINTLETDCYALRADAERYRWLRSNRVGYAMHMGAVLYTPELVVPRGMDENGIDAALDAARAREQT